MKSDLIHTLISPCPERLLPNRESSGHGVPDHIPDVGKMVQPSSALLPNPDALDA